VTSPLTNPEAFQLETATILAAGYSAFPTAFGWVYDPDTDRYPTDSGRSRQQIQFETILWLTDNGYLYGGGVIEGQWLNLRLTERALSALNSVPDVLAGKEPLGKRLTAAVGKGSFETIKQLIPVIIQQALGG
jgi:hypothetical protein